MSSDSWWSREDKLLETQSFQYSGELPVLIERFVFARGLNVHEAKEKFISPKLSALADPEKIVGMSIATKRLSDALAKAEKVCVYGDFDLDGSCGLAILMEGLTQLGFKNLLSYQPSRLRVGYGVHTAAIEKLSELGVKLVLTVDVGVTAFAACKRAKELGIDVIITDHHQPENELPQAFVVVNPNRADCQSGLGYLCGAGVGYYLLRSLKRTLFEMGLISREQCDLKALLDFLTIATLTDLVPLIEDNRTLIKLGMKVLAKTPRPGLRQLMNELNLRSEILSSQDIAIRLAPKLNALSRLDKGLRPVDLLLATDELDAQIKVKEVMKSQKERVDLQKSAEIEALKILTAARPEEDFNLVCSEHFHKGVIGLIATKIADSTLKPSFVGSIDPAGQISGSARSPKSSSRSVLEGLKSASASLEKFGGHHQAAGFELNSNMLESFRESIRKHFALDAQNSKKTQPTEYDLRLRLTDMSIGLVKWLLSFEPFGTAFPVPTFCFSKIKILTVKNLNGGHLKITVRDQSTIENYEALIFSPPPGFAISDFENRECDLIGEIQINSGFGATRLQILVKEIRVSIQPRKSSDLPAFVSVQ